MTAPGIIGGLLAGLAASLHCLGMCGGISMTLALAGGPGSGARSVRNAAIAAHGGRLLSYMLLGGLAGTFGATMLGGLDGALGHHILRWGAGLTLGWMGLAQLGLAPVPASLDRAMRSLAPAMARLVPMGPGTMPLIAGIGWGLMPCGMVYAALIAAIFSGSALGGIAVMLGFGLGTLPAHALLSMGAGWLSASRTARVRTVLGLLMLVTAVGATVMPEAGFPPLCGSR